LKVAVIDEYKTALYCILKSIELINEITQVAYETGFTSLKYFRKCFRGYYSKSPSEYAREEVISQLIQDIWLVLVILKQ